jgi:hypothetical protein
MRALVGPILAGVLGVLVLSACDGSSADEPPILPSLSASPSASSSAPTAMPTGRDAPTAQGAAEFAKYFYSQIETAFATRDPSLVSGLSAPGCTSCRQYVQSLTKLRNNNERVEGFDIVVSAAIAPASTTPVETRVDVVWSYGGAKRYDAEGRLIREEPPTKGIEEQVNLVRLGNSWRVAEIKRIRVRG